MSLTDHRPPTPFMRPQDVVPAEYANRLEIYATTDPISHEWAAAAAIEAQVFVSSHYVRDAAELAEEYAPYVPTSEMLGLRTKPDATMLGASRVADPHPEHGLKTLHDIETGRLKLHKEGRTALKAIDPERTMSIDTISLEEKYRGAASAGYVGLLYSAQYVRAVNKNYPHIVASFDAGYWSGFHKRFEHFAEDIGPAVEYMGSLTVPVLIDVTKASLNDFRPRRVRTEPVQRPPQRPGLIAEAA